jgi:hypothetical protein
MSISIIRLIPDDPRFIPVHSAQVEAEKLVTSMLPKAEKVIVIVTENINFVDPGGNLERIFCPICGSEISLEWWKQAMSKAYETKFTDLTVEMPHCGQLSSLNELRYVWEAGFARFVIEAHDPQDDITNEELTLIGAQIGCDLKKIRAHY